MGILCSLLRRDKERASRFSRSFVATAFCFSKRRDTTGIGGPTYEMAVFHEVEDDRTGEKNIIGIYDRSFIDAAQTIEGTPKLTSLQSEALNYLDALCVKQQIDMRLHSGDIQWLHNHTTFHARSAFKDESEFPRHYCASAFARKRN